MHCNKNIAMHKMFPDASGSWAGFSTPALSCHFRAAHFLALLREPRDLRIRVFGVQAITSRSREGHDKLPTLWHWPALRVSPPNVCMTPEIRTARVVPSRCALDLVALRFIAACFWMPVP